ncbi:MAG: imelysin family protein [Pseudomonadota bacterium]
MRALVILALLALPTLAAANSPLSDAQRDTLQAGLIATADAFIRPAYEAQADAAAELADALSAHCAGNAPIGRAKDAFVDTFLAWQRASLIHLGPITDAEGPMRVQLWPDTKGFSARAIRTAIARKDPALLAAGGLTGRSIALTNLTALEHLLYGDLPPGTYACDLAIAIATFQADLGKTLVAAWAPGHPFRTAYDTAAAGNPTFPNVEALVREFLAGAVVYVDRLRKFKLNRGLGAAPGEARPTRTEARRSGAGLQSIEASFRALADLYDVPFGLFDTAPDIGGSMEYIPLGGVAGAIADTLAAEPRTLDAIAEEDGAFAADLRRYSGLVGFQETFLKTGFTSALGLTAGFTAADGD